MALVSLLEMIPLVKANKKMHCQKAKNKSTLRHYFDFQVLMLLQRDIKRSRILIFSKSIMMMEESYVKSLEQSTARKEDAKKRMRERSWKMNGIKEENGTRCKSKIRRETKTPRRGKG